MNTDTPADWTAGYVADIGYTYGYYRELNPLRVGLAFASAGLAAPVVRTACELGYGQGLSVNLHAAASDVQWHGTDFNPSQAAFARELAAAAGSGAQLVDQSFADFCAREDLPEFDFIGLHGIWSWISDANRAVIVDFVRRRLRVGGVLYISYNTMPGWAAFAPMRHLLVEHAEVLGAEGRGIVSRIDGALEFADRLMALNPQFARANPLVGERIRQLKGLNRHYLAHEYFNRDWHPMPFATMADWLAPAKLQYACSAHLLDHVDAINLTSEQQSFLADIPDRMFRESTRDFIVNAVAETGGHLGSNLGAVELSIALHRVFESPTDAVLWDTGHQAYVHKILTGRQSGFSKLRQHGGISGYPSREESRHDFIENSHASTVLSYAHGMAVARDKDQLGDRRHVVADRPFRAG